MEWDSLTQTVTSVLACIAAMVALLTVYFALVQHSERSQMLDAATSYEAIGPWRDKAYRRPILRLGIPVTSAPYINLKKLIEVNWTPLVKYPDGKYEYTKGSHRREMDIESGLDALFPSWPKFLQAVSIDPYDSHERYTMQQQSELFSGKLPMIWSGRDLLTLCSALGFQVPRNGGESSMYREAMPLPMNWQSPMGFLCFREHAIGCIVEFRRLKLHIDQIEFDVRKYYMNQSGHGIRLKSRLWNAINGLELENGKLLYLGGANPRRRKIDSSPEDSPDRRKVSIKASGVEKNNLDNGGETSKQDKNQLHPVDQVRSGQLSETSDITSKFQTEFNQNLAGFQPKTPKRSWTDDQLSDMNHARHCVDPNAFMAPYSQQNRAAYNGGHQKNNGIPEMLRELMDLNNSGEEDKGGNNMRLQTFVESDGLLTTILEGELASSRGLDVSSENCRTYMRVYHTNEKPDELKAENGSFHKFGNLWLNHSMLTEIKEAVLLLAPDGYWFCPGPKLAHDMRNIWTNVRKAIKSEKHPLSKAFLDKGSTLWQDSQLGTQYVEPLRYGARVSATLAKNRVDKKVDYSIEDMTVIGMASQMLRNFSGNKGNKRSEGKIQELLWCMIYSTVFFSELLKKFSSLDPSTFDAWKDICFEAESGKLTSTGKLLEGSFAETIPLLGKNEFSGYEVLAAYIEPIITVVWMKKKIITNVSYFNAGVPQTLIMV